MLYSQEFGSIRSPINAEAFPLHIRSTRSQIASSAAKELAKVRDQLKESRKQLINMKEYLS